MTSDTQPNVVIDWIGGNCPVQAEGTINGKPFYFRARGETWSVEIGDFDNPQTPNEWEHAEWHGVWPEAGWITPEQAEAFIRQAAERYAAGLPGGRLQDDRVRMAQCTARLDALYGRVK